MTFGEDVHFKVALAVNVARLLTHSVYPVLDVVVALDMSDDILSDYHLAVAVHVFFAGFCHFVHTLDSPLAFKHVLIRESEAVFFKYGFVGEQHFNRKVVVHINVARYPVEFGVPQSERVDYVLVPP